MTFSSPITTTWGNNFNPARVMYKAPAQPAQAAATAPAIQPYVSAESVRATGSGPFDPAYRQNLATYAGGLFQRPGGNLSFNPTSGQFPGNPSGGGNAPVAGLPNSLMDAALGGNPFSFTPQSNQATAPAVAQPASDYWKFWLNQYNSPMSIAKPVYSTY